MNRHLKPNTRYTVKFPSLIDILLGEVGYFEPRVEGGIHIESEHYEQVLYYPDIGHTIVLRSGDGNNYYYSPIQPLCYNDELGHFVETIKEEPLT